MRSTVLAVLALSGLTFASAKCPNVPTADSKFVLPAYLGKWYEVSKNSGFARVFERDGYCITAEYSDNGDGTIKVDNGLSKGGPTGSRTDAIATAKQVDGAKLGVSFYLPSFDFSYQPYWVVDLVGSAEDGYDVAVVYSCSTTLGLFDNANVWVLSRTPALPTGITLDLLYGRLAANGVDVAALKMVSNDITGCYPKAAMASVFDGDYSDPNHPSCRRSVSVSPDGLTAAVSGEDGDEGSNSCANPTAWGPLRGAIDGNSIKIDFSPKGGPSDLTASYDVDGEGIRFSDGNLWQKI